MITALIMWGLYVGYLRRQHRKREERWASIVAVAREGTYAEVRSKCGDSGATLAWLGVLRKELSWSFPETFDPDIPYDEQVRFRVNNDRSPGGEGAMPEGVDPEAPAHVQGTAVSIDEAKRVLSGAWLIR